MPSAEGQGGVFEVQGQVTIEGKPFVLTTIDEKPFGQLTPEESIALGVRAISAGIEAERDAGLIRFLQAREFDTEVINVMLNGVREYRDQYDPPEGLGN